MHGNRPLEGAPPGLQQAHVPFTCCAVSTLCRQLMKIPRICCWTCSVERGGGLGNRKAQKLLSWSDEVYQTMKAALIDDNLITPGRGRGGSIILKESIESSSTSSNNTEQETFSAPPQPGALDLESRKNLRTRLEKFGSKAGSRREHCSSNERQTERLLVEPYWNWQGWWNGGLRRVGSSQAHMVD